MSVVSFCLLKRSMFITGNHIYSVVLFYAVRLLVRNKLRGFNITCSLRVVSGPVLAGVPDLKRCVPCVSSCQLIFHRRIRAPTSGLLYIHLIRIIDVICLFVFSPIDCFDSKNHHQVVGAS